MTAATASSFLTRNLNFGTGKGNGLQLGLITNLIESDLNRDWQSTLISLANIGYKYLEFNTIADVPRERIKPFLKEIGIKPLSGGDAMANLKKADKFKKMVDDALFYEKRYLICYWPWMDNGDNKKLDDFKRTAAELNELGEKCSSQGLTFAFHNHNKEFIQVTKSTCGYEILLEQTDPGKVTMLLDLYWATKGGGDVIRLFKQYAGRFDLLHIKDMDKTPLRGMTCPGYGTLDFQSLLSSAKTSGVKYFVVEVDHNEQPMNCAAESFKYLDGLDI